MRRNLWWILLMIWAHAAAAVEVGSLKEARQNAKETGKPILIELETEWCGYCKLFARDYAAMPDLKKALEPVVFVRIDAEKGEGIELAKQYKPQGYPTFQLVDAEMQTISSWLGYEKEFFLAALSRGLADPISLETRRARFEEEPNATDAVTLARHHEAKGEYIRAVRLFRKAQKLDADANHHYTIFDIVLQGHARGLFMDRDLEKAATTVIESKRASLPNIMQVAHSMSRVAQRAENTDMMAPYLAVALERSRNSPDERVQQQRRSLLVTQALHLTRDVPRAVELRKASMADGWTERAADLNSFAWWCFENGINLTEAEQMARRGVELAENDQDKATILDTLAEIRNAQGHVQEAVRLIEEAIQADAENHYYREQLQRFQELAAAGE